MPHISLNPEEAGIISLFSFSPATARPMSELAEVLLRGPSSLTRGERELIAAHVSSLNDCHFCASSHGAFAAAQLPEGMELVQQVRADPQTAPVSDKLRALLAIAGAVQESGLKVTSEQVAAASESKNRFWANVSHELRTPLNSIIALARLLADPAGASTRSSSTRWG